MGLAVLTGVQTGVLSTASGFGSIVINDAAKTVTANLNVANVVNATMAHIHGPAFPGSINDPVCILASSATVAPFSAPAVSFSCGNYSDHHLMLMRAGQMYFNIHTLQNAAGELRGQIIFPSQLDPNFVAVANIAQTVPAFQPGSSPAPVYSAGTGAAIILRPAGVPIAPGGSTMFVGFGAVTGLNGTQTNAHLHGLPSKSVYVGLPPSTGSFSYAPMYLNMTQTIDLMSNKCVCGEKAAAACDLPAAASVAVTIRLTIPLPRQDLRQRSYQRGPRRRNCRRGHGPHRARPAQLPSRPGRPCRGALKSRAQPREGLRVSQNRTSRHGFQLASMRYFPFQLCLARRSPFRRRHRPPAPQALSSQGLSVLPQAMGVTNTTRDILNARAAAYGGGVNSLTVRLKQCQKRKETRKIVACPCHLRCPQGARGACARAHHSSICALPAAGVCADRCRVLESPCACTPPRLPLRTCKSGSCLSCALHTHSYLP